MAVRRIAVKIIGPLTLALGASILLGGMVMAASVEPYVVPQVPGGPGNECESIGEYVYDFKIDDWNEATGGNYTATFDDGHSNTFTITNNDDTYFDWSATNPIGAVFVKGGPVANVYEYVPQADSDTLLNAPTNPTSGQPYGISHVTFCWNPQEDQCFEDETGWGAGTRYVRRGNWATYTPYGTLGDGCYTLFAGQTMDAGEVCFQAQGSGVRIWITLNPGWTFSYSDDYGNLPQNIHIQGYDDPPTRNPAPGRFEYKFTQSGTEWHGWTVDWHPYYGVHVALQHEVPCP